MALTAAHVRPYLGQQVVVHSNYGIHSGVLHQIRQDGIVLSNVRAMRTSGQAELSGVQTADKPEALQAEEAFWPFFFFPWFALWALGPWGLWW